MKKSIIFTAALAAVLLLAGCEQEVVNPDEPDTLPMVLSGVFSVSATQQVKFSRGNLQYTFPAEEGGEGTWSFAAHQSDFIGTDNVTGGEPNLNHSPQIKHLPATTYGLGVGFWKEGDALFEKIDLFGWSGNTGTAAWGIGTSIDEHDYSGEFKDWGQNIGDGKTWRTLSKDEWDYLFNTRANASSLYGVARINLNADGTEYANGMILLPDNWQAPDGIDFKNGLASDEGVEAYGEYQTFGLSEWEVLEANGAVFLPAAGCRSGESVSEVQGDGNYWSSSYYNSNYAYYVGFNSDRFHLVPYGEFRSLGFSVRLVQDL